MIINATTITNEVSVILQTLYDYTVIAIHYLPVIKPYFVGIMEYLKPILVPVVPVYVTYKLALKFLDKKKLVKELLTTYRDLEFFYALEKEHVELHKLYINKSMKNTARDNVRNAENKVLSINNTPAKLKIKIANLEELDKKLQFPKK
ncbi:hypothetical protein GLP21_12040 [Photobacterium carnosum]|uniref:Uncharacterized protein n=1 Tax=Photobacterium carnosum TaxID=2023717 RepID=A0A2N4UVZ5_9GAMM|nr:MULTISPECIES: hypothetical protein [Photobacterium]MCD9475788.1 hypothetical protein [Photobacterium phosphoreum]MCD9485846.1 hypothetical protein [Photobacterium iliopiscarium]MCD9507649.1 hypothetical protein [Photobacterium phosphoreum]MCD9539521.1 hypothetical protein [Photobacterium carnosum]MCD9543201.1 hypothetical protein [Photobacterium carnosum]